MIANFLGQAERHNEFSSAIHYTIFVKVRGREYEIPVDYYFEPRYVVEDGLIELHISADRPGS